MLILLCVLGGLIALQFLLSVRHKTVSDAIPPLGLVEERGSDPIVDLYNFMERDRNGKKLRFRSRFTALPEIVWRKRDRLLVSHSIAVRRRRDLLADRLAQLFMQHPCIRVFEAVDPKLAGILSPGAPCGNPLLGVFGSEKSGPFAAEAVMLKGLQPNAFSDDRCTLLMEIAVITVCAAGLGQPVSHALLLSSRSLRQSSMSR